MHSGKRRSIVGLTFSSPHSFHSGGGSQRFGAVKGAPFFGAAQRTLDGENRCETITKGRNELFFHSAYPLQSLNSLKLTPRANGRWAEAVLYNFCSQSNCTDGGGSVAGLIFDAAGNLYGTTESG